DAGKHHYQSFFNVVLFTDLQRQFLFRLLGRWQVLIRSAQLAGGLFRLFYNPLRQAFSVAAKIFEQDVLAVQENLQPANMSNRSQGAAEQHPIKSRKSTGYAAVVPPQKTLHDSPPAFCLSAQTYFARNVSHGAFLIWLRLCRAV